ncbi:MAG: glycosyltransferase family 4 protein [Alphaproteobacteria bacterium]|nr:glycosyltransferase family 4 protein [Alphaproteobacteria bacterium]
MSRASLKSEPLVFLVRGDEGYGARRITADLIAGLLARGYRVLAFSLLEGEMTTACNRAGAACEVLSAQSLARPYGQGIGARLRSQVERQRQLRALQESLNAYVARVKPGALIVGLGDLVAAAGKAASRTGARCLWIMHSILSDAYPLALNKRLYRSVIARYGLTPVANSQFTAATLGPSVVPARVLHLGADARQFSPDAATPFPRAAAHIPQNAAVACILGRLVEEKGQARILEALALAGEAASSLHLLICGGPMNTRFAAKLEALAQSVALSGRVHFTGAVTDPVPYLLASDFLISSRLTPEPFGLSIIEAMLLARPVLAHGLGGPAETVSDGETGWLMGPATAEGFRDGLLRALGDRARWPEMGAAARALAHQHYTLEKVLDRFEAILEEAPQCRQGSLLTAMGAML